MISERDRIENQRPSEQPWRDRVYLNRRVGMNSRWGARKSGLLKKPPLRSAHDGFTYAGFTQIVLALPYLVRVLEIPPVGEPFDQIQIGAR